MPKTIKVRTIDHKAIFERAAGHSAEATTKTVICFPEKAGSQTDFDQVHTMTGKLKPSSFAIVPKRWEQFFI